MRGCPAVAGVEPRAILTPAHIEPDIDGGRAAAAEALDRWPEADALVCFNDATALGAMKELSSRGINVPDNVAVVGIDGLALGVVVTPELTTLQFDFAAMAELTVDLVTEIAGGRRQTHGVEVHRDISPVLLIRRPRIIGHQLATQPDSLATRLRRSVDGTG